MAQRANDPLNHFVFVDHGSIFNDLPGCGLLPPYRTNLMDDQLHWGCLGYQLALGILAQYAFDPLPAASGNFAILPVQPGGRPKASSSLPTSSVFFRYALHYVPVGHTLSLTVSGAIFHYAAVFNPAFPTGLPQVEDARFFANAYVTFINPFNFPCPVILCIGTGSGFGNYSVT